VDPEVDVFPGDIGMFTAADPPRIAVIQAMNSKKRVIDLRWYEEGLNGTVETVSGLEFDQHGPPPEVYGVKRQEVVLVTKEGTTNAHEIPTVPRLGESEVATGNFPDAETLRHQMATLGMELDRQLEWDKSAVPDRSKGRLKSINWYGIVSDLLLDGRVVVQYPSGDTETLPLDRLYLLDDGLGPDGHHHDDDGMSVDQDSQDSWQTDSDADAIGQSKVEDVDGQEDGDSPRGKQDVEQEKARGWAEETADADATAEVSMPAETEDEENWKRFEVLEDAPGVSVREMHW
jgi:ubiquitin-conjugating enzyme E2 O